MAAEWPACGDSCASGRGLGAAGLHRARPGHREAPLRQQDGPGRQARGRAGAGRNGGRRRSGGLQEAKASVAELLERWFEHVRQDFLPSTERETRAILDRSILPALGSVPLNKLTVADIDRFYRRLLKAGGKDGRPLAPATVRRAHVVLRRALAQGVKWGWLVRNPAADASPPRVAKTEIHPPAPAEVARLFLSRTTLRTTLPATSTVSMTSRMAISTFLSCWSTSGLPPCSGGRDRRSPVPWLRPRKRWRPGRGCRRSRPGPGPGGRTARRAAAIRRPRRAGR
jgi:hypothetical protein